MKKLPTSHVEQQTFFILISWMFFHNMRLLITSKKNGENMKIEHNRAIKHNYDHRVKIVG